MRQLVIMLWIIGVHLAYKHILHPIYMYNNHMYRHIHTTYKPIYPVYKHRNTMYMHVHSVSMHNVSSYRPTQHRGIVGTLRFLFTWLLPLVLAQEVVFRHSQAGRYGNRLGQPACRVIPRRNSRADSVLMRECFRNQERNSLSYRVAHP